MLGLHSGFCQCAVGCLLAATEHTWGGVHHYNRNSFIPGIKRKTLCNGRYIQTRSSLLHNTVCIIYVIVYLSLCARAAFTRRDCIAINSLSSLVASRCLIPS